MTLIDWHMSSSPLGCALPQPLMACEGVTLTVRPATATEGVRGRDAHRPAHDVVGRSLTLLSLYCVVPTGAGRSFGAGGASRTGRATPCEGRGRPGYGGGAVVPGSMRIGSCCGAGDGNGLRRRICFSRVHRNLKRGVKLFTGSSGFCKERNALYSKFRVMQTA